MSASLSVRSVSWESSPCSPLFASSSEKGVSGTASWNFEGHQDVGTVLHAGSVQYDRGKQTYKVSRQWREHVGSALNDFHFVWKKVSGDVALASNIDFVGAGAMRTARPF